MLEYEKKVMLTEEEYTALVMMCKNAPVKIQKNYYFDTKDYFMNKRGITCRIREKDGVFKSTIKNHSIEQLDCSIEEDLMIKTEFDSKIFDSLGFCLQGELVTERIVIHKDFYCNMVIDRNTYLGYTDFELEIEYTKENVSKIEMLLMSIAEALVGMELLTNTYEFLERVCQGMSKSQRFFERKKKLGEKDEICFDRNN